MQNEIVNTPKSNAKTIDIQFYNATYLQLKLLLFTIIFSIPIIYLVDYILKDYTIDNTVKSLLDAFMRDYIGFVLLAILFLYGWILFKMIEKYRKHKQAKTNYSKTYLAHLKAKVTLRKKYVVNTRTEQMTGFDLRESYTNSYAYCQWQFISENGQFVFVLDEIGWIKQLAFKLYYKKNKQIEVAVDETETHGFI